MLPSTMRRLATIACAAAAILLATSLDRSAISGAPSDFADVPESIAVDARGEVIVGFYTDVSSSEVRRFSPSGGLLSATDWGRVLQPHARVAEGPNGTSFAGQTSADEIAVVDANGLATLRWPVAGFGNAQDGGGALSSGLFEPPDFASVFALVEEASGRSVVRFTADGSTIDRWPVDPSAYDLTVGRDDAGVPTVWVVSRGQISGTSTETAHALDGTTVVSATLWGDVLGYDALPNGKPLAVLRPHLSPTVHVGGPMGWVVAGDPVDMAVAPNGDLFIVSRLNAARPLDGIVLHYTAAGCLIATWSNALLNGDRSATPMPGPSPCPGQDVTPTSTPDGGGTPTTSPTTPVDPSTATPTASLTPPTTGPATATASATASATATTSEGGPRLYLPVAFGGQELPGADHGAVVVQVQHGGGLPSPPYFQIQIERAPWFTLYADGTYVRSRMERPLAWYVGRIPVDRARALVDRLLADEPIFSLLNHMCHGVCECFTDGPYTRILLRDGDRRVTTSAYLLSWYGLPGRCKRVPIRPTPLPGDRMLAFAQAIASLDAPLDPLERIGALGHVTLYAEPNEDTWLPPLPWPLDRPIQAVVGRDTLTPTELTAIVEAYEAAGDEYYHWARSVPFADDAGTYEVGIRVEAPGWMDYCEEEPRCPDPLAQPAPAQP